MKKKVKKIEKEKVITFATALKTASRNRTRSNAGHQLPGAHRRVRAAPYPHHGFHGGHDRRSVLQVYVRSLAETTQ